LLDEVLSAIKQKSFYELCSNPKTREIIDSLFNESYAVLFAYIPLLGSREELRIKFYDTVSSMRHYSSTYQDAIASKRTEINFLNGLIIQLGKKFNIPTPKNVLIYKKFLEKYKK
jgi:2-dehydropantoate 2-reductase